MTPPFPTTHPLLASEKETAFNIFVVPLDCALHEDPPFVVFTIVPSRPTAHPVVELRNLTP
jgi:hypothetical protein